MKVNAILSLVLMLCLVAGCVGVERVTSLTGGNKTVVSIVYGSEKEEWLEPLVEAYNAAQHETADGSIVVIEATPMGSIESIEAIMSGRIEPTVWSPASSVYLPVAQNEWRTRNGAELFEGTPEDLVLSPVVIAMWRPMAEALGWPETPIGWTDVAQLAISDEGWEVFGFPEWGEFKFGHTHPNYSNSGLVSILAETYAGAGKQRGLTLDDVISEEVSEFVGQVESAIIHYGKSTGFFANRMFERGPSYLSAAVMYENLVVAQEEKRLRGQSAQVPVVAIYPKEGTFWSNHPYVILDAPWVTPEQKAAAEDFQAFLLATPQQEQAVQYGFRPADPAVGLSSPLDIEHGVDPGQPQTVLEVPEAEVIESAQRLWKQVKKPVDLTLVVDTSGSMSGDKIASVRSSLVEFLNLLDNRDRVQIVVFNSDVTTITPLAPLADKRAEMIQRVSGLVEGGDTSLYDATLQAYNDLEQNGDPEHIRAVVVLSDGEDTSSLQSLSQVTAAIGDIGEEGGNAIKVFTIAFGSGADTGVLRQLAEVTGGRQYSGEPENIRDVYAEIALFF
jgi:Ca-activated chloride channel family protein